MYKYIAVTKKGNRIERVLDSPQECKDFHIQLKTDGHEIVDFDCYEVENNPNHHETDITLH